ncbi:MAG: hypothetical protein QOH87_1295, partial [Trebonia sp.]|nr:hypothetical protein [Trebonia sp.]
MPDKLLDLARAGGIRLSIAVAGSQDSPAPAMVESERNCQNQSNARKQ